MQIADDRWNVFELPVVRRDWLRWEQEPVIIRDFPREDAASRLTPNIGTDVDININLADTLKLHAAWLRNETDGRRANLSEADLSKANLSGADLSKANLSGADLSKADLSKANLSGANLSGADLSKANLSKANLSGANLYGADLSEADLSKADLSKADLRRRIDCNTNYDGARISYRGKTVIVRFTDAASHDGQPQEPHDAA